jgi:hypothetical protein
LFDTKTDDYSTVLKNIKSFLAQPFAAAIENENFTKQWTVLNCEWK